MVRKLQNYINGQWSDVLDAQTLDVMNPATDEVLARVLFHQPLKWIEPHKLPLLHSQSNHRSAGPPIGRVNFRKQ